MSHHDNGQKGNNIPSKLKSSLAIIENNYGKNEHDEHARLQN